MPYIKTKTPKLEANDSDKVIKDASFLRNNEGGRFPEKQEARLAKQFLRQNRGLLQDFDVNAYHDYDGSNVKVIFETGSKVGAIPLLSPVTGQPDFSFLIKPRFSWNGIGPLLGEMGWRIVPEPLKLPLLPHSARNIPPWVLSSMVLNRLRKLIKNLSRSFELTKQIKRAPKGQVDWTEYAQSYMAKGKFLNVPCRYSRLSDHRELKRAIHYTLCKQLSSLESQRSMGPMVVQLIDFCKELICSVSDVQPKKPASQNISSWLRDPLNRDVFKEGLQAIEWTIEDRGFAGLSEFEGIPWRLPMEEFFEAWIEYVFSKIAKQIGATISVGRKSETTQPIHWEPSYYGSQKSLRPDLMLHKEDEVIIVDAKYKHHLQQLQSKSWHEITQNIKEKHRNDLLQVLAYSAIPEATNVTTILIYPCSENGWERLQKSGQLFYQAAIRSGKRNIRLLLTSVPISTAKAKAYIEEFVNFYNEQRTGKQRN